MTNEIVALVQEQVASRVRRVAVPAAFAVVGAIFVLFTVAGLFAALFFWFEPEHGPVNAALLCAVVALILAGIAFVPLLFGRRKPPPPKTEMFPQFVTLMAKSAPGLKPRQLIVAAVLVGAALVLSARGGKK